MSDETNFGLPAPEVFGPQGEHVVALLERARHLTPDEASALADARYAALDDTWDGAWVAACNAAWVAACNAALDDTWDAAWDTAWNAMSAAVPATEGGGALYAALDTACALVVRDFIPSDCYDTLTRPWRTVIGPIHPDDPDMRQP